MFFDINMFFTVIRSISVQKKRISKRSSVTIIDDATGEIARINGPVLVVVINEKLFSQGW